MINKQILVGRLTTTPEIRHSETTTFANFDFVTSEVYYNKQGEKIEDNEYHKVSVIGKLADIVEKYVAKGQLLYLEGKKKTRSYENKEGNKVYIVETIVDFNGVIRMLGKKSESSEQLPDTSKTNVNNPEPDGDIPF